MKKVYPARYSNKKSIIMVMENWEVQLSTILNDTLRPMEFALFFNDNDGEDYKCIYTNFERYKGKQDYDIYSIPSLMSI